VSTVIVIALLVATGLVVIKACVNIGRADTAQKDWEQHRYGSRH
jgi:hypothetical protein